MNIHLGFDIGSISVNTVVMDKNRNIIKNRYDYCHGRPFHILKDIISDIIKEYKNDSIVTIATTGTGGKKAVEAQKASSRASSKFLKAAAATFEMFSLIELNVSSERPSSQNFQ